MAECLIGEVESTLPYIVRVVDPETGQVIWDRGSGSYPQDVVDAGGDGQSVFLPAARMMETYEDVANNRTLLYVLIQWTGRLYSVRVYDAETGEVVIDNPADIYDAEDTSGMAWLLVEFDTGRYSILSFRNATRQLYFQTRDLEGEVVYITQPIQLTNFNRDSIQDINLGGNGNEPPLGYLGDGFYVSNMANQNTEKVIRLFENFLPVVINDTIANNAHLTKAGTQYSNLLHFPYADGTRFFLATGGGWMSTYDPVSETLTGTTPTVEERLLECSTDGRFQTAEPSGAVSVMHYYTALKEFGGSNFDHEMDGDNLPLTDAELAWVAAPDTGTTGQKFQLVDPASLSDVDSVSGAYSLYSHENGFQSSNEVESGVFRYGKPIGMIDFYLNDTTLLHNIGTGNLTDHTYADIDDVLNGIAPGARKVMWFGNDYVIGLNSHADNDPPTVSGVTLQENYDIDGDRITLKGYFSDVDYVAPKSGVFHSGSAPGITGESVPNPRQSYPDFGGKDLTHTPAGNNYCDAAQQNASDYYDDEGSITAGIELFYDVKYRDRQTPLKCTLSAEGPYYLDHFHGGYGFTGTSVPNSTQFANSIFADGEEADRAYECPEGYITISYPGRYSREIPSTEGQQFETLFQGTGPSGGEGAGTAVRHYWHGTSAWEPTDFVGTKWDDPSMTGWYWVQDSHWSRGFTKLELSDPNGGYSIANAETVADFGSGFSVRTSKLAARGDGKDAFGHTKPVGAPYIRENWAINQNTGDYEPNYSRLGWYEYGFGSVDGGATYLPKNYTHGGSPVAPQWDEMFCPRDGLCFTVLSVLDKYDDPDNSPERVSLTANQKTFGCWIRDGQTTFDVVDYEQLISDRYPSYEFSGEVDGFALLMNSEHLGDANSDYVVWPAAEGNGTANTGSSLMVIDVETETLKNLIIFDGPSIMDCKLLSSQRLAICGIHAGTMNGREFPVFVDEPIAVE